LTSETSFPSSPTADIHILDTTNYKWVTKYYPNSSYEEPSPSPTLNGNNYNVDVGMSPTMSIIVAISIVFGIVTIITVFTVLSLVRIRKGKKYLSDNVNVIVI